MAANVVLDFGEGQGSENEYSRSYPGGVGLVDLRHKLRIPGPGPCVGNSHEAFRNAGIPQKIHRICRIFRLDTTLILPRAARLVIVVGLADAH